MKSARYKDVIEYSKKHYDFVIQSCWIAHIKELHGLSLNSSGRGNLPRQKLCPEDKKKLVERAMRAVGMM